MSGRDLYRRMRGFGLDRTAVALSGLCLVHCAGSAVVLAMVASTGGALLGHGVHEVGLALALALGVIALGTGLCRHGGVLPAVIGAGGLALMAWALTLPHGGLEILLNVTGVCVLAFAHLLNRRAVLATG